MTVGLGHYRIIIFLLTRLIRGVTDPQNMIGLNAYISTHTPHTRRDALQRPQAAILADFYSHASYEA